MVAGAVVCCVAAGLLELNQECFAGVGDGAAAGAGAGAVVAAVFFECLVAAGDEAGADEVVVVAGAVVAAAVSFFFERLCFAGDASGVASGVCASNEVVENPINRITRPINLFMGGWYSGKEPNGNDEMR